MINPFYRTRLIYKISVYISNARNTLLEDLVAYTNDPVRLKRRIRMLIQLSDYEQNTLIKIRDFDTDNIEDMGQDILGRLQQEVDSITNRDS